jgi:RNA 2',3'-cyclic 3'-phosphodiesterase
MRCFIALPLPPEARDDLARAATACRSAIEPAAARCPGSRLSWTRPEGYHLTLAFLGELEGQALRAAEEGLDAALGFGSFPFSFSALGAFPPRGGWRVLHAAIEAGDRAAKLHSLVKGALSLPRAEAGRPFAAHITLARSTGAGFSLPGGFLGTELGLGSGYAFTRCVLYRSELHSGGSVYTELRAVELS